MKMKTTVIIMLYTVLLSLSCTKSSDDNTNNETKPTIKITRSLTNLSLDSTKYFLHGNWRWVCTLGGYIPSQTFFTDKFINIDTGRMKMQTIESGIIDSSDIKFIKRINIFYSGIDSIEVLTQYYNNSNPPIIGMSLFPLKYEDDTLVLKQYASDGKSYYLIRK
jgi:hypothetical protein